MKQNVITSIDIGSSFVRCIISAQDDESASVRILGVGAVPAEGMRAGAVIDIADATNAISMAVEKAEAMSGVHVRNAIVSIGGNGIAIQETRGVVVIGRADGEVTDDDVMRVVDAAQSMIAPANRDVIHVIPRTFQLDEQKNISDPIGLRGMRLEVDAVTVEAPTNHVKNLTLAMERAEIVVDEFVVEPLAAAEAVLTKKQRELGVAVVVMGASTTSVAIYEEGDLIHAAIIPIGSDFITKDLAIGLRTSIDVAEQVKFTYGSVMYDSVKRTDEINLGEFDEHDNATVLHDHVIEITIARMEEIFEFVRKEFIAIGKDQLLPAGVVLTGGGANMVHIVEFAKEALQLPVHLGHAEGLLGTMDQVDDPSFSTAIGLTLWYNHYGQNTQGGIFLRGGMQAMTHGVSGRMQTIVSGIKKLFNRFLP